MSALLAPVTRASTSCDNVFSAGPISKRVRFCISNDGNVVGFSIRSRLTQLELWQPIDNIRVGVIGEGYVLCDLDSKATSFDAGFDRSGWGPSVVIQPNGPNTLPLTIKRKTTDGRFELTQVFSVETSSREILIAMGVKNLSASPAHLALVRYADFDLNGTSGGDVYIRSRDSVFGREGDVMSLTSLVPTFDPVVATAIERKSDWGSLAGAGTHTTCSAVPQSGATADDYVARITFTFSLAAGSSKAVVVAYRGQ
jgi:hypothetical protein